MKPEKVICPYCDEQAIFTTSKKVYGGRDFGMIYLCEPCNAWVGVHKGTAKPLGRLADDELRYWKRMAHASFDPIWKKRFEEINSKDPKYKKHMARSGRYKLLAKEMNISRDECHIGMFNVEQCQEVIKICNSGALSESSVG